MFHNKKISTIFISMLVLIVLLSTIIFTGCISKRDTFRFDGEKRSYIIDLPNSYNPSNEYPLVLVFHGGGGNAKNIKEVTNFSLKGEEENFIVVYPDGSGKLNYRLLTWNCGFCCGYALEHNIDDIGFIRALIEYLTDEYNIDESMIYATGLSNGGIMSYYVGAALSDIFAAVAPVAAQIGGQATEQEKIWRIPVPENPVSILAINGMNDSRVPYDGGRPADNDTAVYSWISTNESISFWVTQNQCNSFPERNISDSGNIIIDTYAGGLDSTMVRLISIVDGTHSWPGGEKGWDQGAKPTSEINATDIIWEFFKDHPKQ
jgi:polyhydroxybutyrate depolymerase